jgi:uncharacterized Zn finger protein
MTTTISCPECGEPATDESKQKSNLSALGYRHTDHRYRCSECDTQWIRGEPHGGSDKPEWTCDSCGGEYVPHFLFINGSDESVRVRPKCRDCWHVPDERIELNSRFNGENMRAFVGHPSVTGEETEDSFPL